MRLALHVILRLDQEDCILGRGLTVSMKFGNKTSRIQGFSWNKSRMGFIPSLINDRHTGRKIAYILVTDSNT
jgi:hypothetical protein